MHPRAADHRFRCARLSGERDVGAGDRSRPSRPDIRRHPCVPGLRRLLDQRGHAQRVDHRSYERQGVDRQPGEHYGPAAPHLVSRGHEHDRIEGAGDVADSERALSDLDKEIARLETAKETILRDGLPEDHEPDRRDYSHSHAGGSRDDRSWER